MLFLKHNANELTSQDTYFSFCILGDDFNDFVCSPRKLGKNYDQYFSNWSTHTLFDYMI